MFISFTKLLKTQHWQWHFLAILCIGAVACGSSSPHIRRAALEEGLVPSLEFEEGGDCWLIRAGAVVALCEVYQQFKSEPAGLLSRQVMDDRLKRETHAEVIALLKQPKAKTPQEIFTKRISFLFKNTSMEFAETYVEIQSEYQYLRNYVQATEKNESRRKQMQCNRLPNSVQAFKARNSNGATYPLVMSTRNKAPLFQNLEHTLLTTEDYHQNYNLDEDYFNTFLAEHAKTVLLSDHSKNEKTVLPPLFGPSTFSLGVRSVAPTPLPLGTAARRKIFHTNRPRVNSPDELPMMKSSRVTIRIPSAIPIAVEGHHTF